MGNQLKAYDSKQTHSISKFIKTKLKKKHQNEQKLNENFIINHVRNNKHNDNSIDIESLDERRKVFVSLIGLYRSWKKIPSLTLYTSLLIMPMKKQWIYHPSKYAEELKSSFISKISDFSDVAETKHFMECLKWKDSQQLILWMLDESVSDQYDSTDLVSAIWYALSDKLQSLYDPITGSNYNALQLDIKWWQNKKVFISKFNTKPLDIMDELYFVTMKYNTIKEMIYQSNPNTLHPLTVYENNHVVIIQSIFEVDADDANWYISPDYDDDNEDEQCLSI